MIEFQRKYDRTKNDENIFIPQVLSKLDDELKMHIAFYPNFYGALKTLIECSQSYDDVNLIISIGDQGKSLEMKRLVPFPSFERLLLESYQFSIDKDGNMEETISINRAYDAKEYGDLLKNQKPNDDNYTRIRTLLSTYDSPYFSEVRHSYYVYDKDGIQVFGAGYNDIYPKDNIDEDSMAQETIDHMPNEWPINNYPGEIKAAGSVLECFPTRSYSYREPEMCGIMSESIKMVVSCGNRHEESEHKYKYQINTRTPQHLSPSNARAPFAESVDGKLVLTEEAEKDYSGMPLEKVEQFINFRFLRGIEKDASWNVDPSIIETLKQNFLVHALPNNNIDDKNPPPGPKPLS